jgi:hypothetical protein
VVPHVPVCTYAHVREGDTHVAERVEKKTGSKWDRDQAGCVDEALARQGPWLKINAQAASSGRLANGLKASGIGAGRVPPSGAAGWGYIVLPLLGRVICVEAKAQGTGFGELYWCAP